MSRTSCVHHVYCCTACGGGGVAGDGDQVADSLAQAVANASLAAPAPGPSLATMVNTESLESAADKYRDFQEPSEAIQDK